MTRSQIIEVMARGMCRASVVGDDGPFWSEAHSQRYVDANWLNYKRRAEAALTALESTMSDELRAAWEKEIDGNG